jgi:hypothetical protein
VNGTARSIPGAALSAAADAISGQPAGTPAAHLALVALAAAAPLIREHDSAAGRRETPAGERNEENPHDR